MKIKTKNIKHKAKKILTISAFCFLLSAFALTTVSAQEASPGAADSIRERVREKVESIIRQPRAIVGTLAEITDSTLQIQTRTEEILLASTSDETSFMRVVGTRRTEIEFDELVLGDFIIVMGFRNGNDVLEAQRVITYDKAPLAEKRAVFGVVQGIERGTLTIQHPKTAEVWVVETNRDTTVTRKVESPSTSSGFEEIDVDEVQVGNRVVAAGTPVEDKENTLSARRIHVLPGRAEGQQ